MPAGAVGSSGKQWQQLPVCHLRVLLSTRALADLVRATSHDSCVLVRTLGAAVVALLWPDSLTYALSVTLVLCAAWLFLQ